MLTVLATLEPNHPWFKRDYTRREVAQEETVDNLDGFFDNLPPSKGKGPLSARVGRPPKRLTEVQIKEK